ncbi:MAG: LacI family DNA-binding transcriptional regulator [Chloroflexi bacterium]|nr:LacI family DNA-binding transcriptional regulator [Chloroflexota bacterium]
MPTIKEVAEEAGVSPSTVSNVFGGRVPVRQKTRQRVLAAAERLGYRPDGLARALRTGRSQTLGLLVPFITNSTMAAIIHAASKQAYTAAYGLMICALEDDPSLEQTHLQLLHRQRVDGVITLAASDDSRAYFALQQGGTPIVFVHRRPRGIAADLITPDHRTGVRSVVHHLLATGRRRIALLTAPESVGSSSDRAAGYREAYGEAGLPIPRGLIRTGLRVSGDAYRATRDLLYETRPPDAIIAGMASLTIGALACLRDQQVRIPDDIAYVGSGDLEWAPLVEPPLTMLEVDGGQIGHRAVTMLLERLDPQMPPTPPREVVVPVRLAVRRSSGASEASSVGLTIPVGRP